MVINHYSILTKINVFQDMAPVSRSYTLFLRDPGLIFNFIRNIHRARHQNESDKFLFLENCISDNSNVIEQIKFEIQSIISKPKYSYHLFAVTTKIS